jgi:hypothetical protein
MEGRAAAYAFGHRRIRRRLRLRCGSLPLPRLPLNRGSAAAALFLDGACRIGLVVRSFVAGTGALGLHIDNRHDQRRPHRRCAQSGSAVQHSTAQHSTAQHSGRGRTLTGSLAAEAVGAAASAISALSLPLSLPLPSLSSVRARLLARPSSALRSACKHQHHKHRRSVNSEEARAAAQCGQCGQCGSSALIVVAIGVAFRFAARHAARIPLIPATGALARRSTAQDGHHSTQQSAVVNRPFDRRQR